MKPCYLRTSVIVAVFIAAGILYAMDKRKTDSETCELSACALSSGGDAQGRASLVILNEDEWKKRLAPETYRVMRDHGTERPFQNAYWNETRRGIFVSASTGVPLFSTDDKFDSRTGWPSFTKPLLDEVIGEEIDLSHGMRRVEVYSTACGGHLGHVFEDGPAPTGLRYCINSAALDFVPAQADEDLEQLAARLRKKAEENIQSLSEL